MGYAVQVKADTDISQLSNTLYVAPQTVIAGTQPVTLSFCLKNSQPIRNFEFYLTLPDCLQVRKNIRGRITGVQFNPNRLPNDDEHTLTLSTLDMGYAELIRFVVASIYDETFIGNDGEVLSMTVDLISATPGEYPIVLEGISLTTGNPATNYYVESVETTLTVETATGIDSVETAPADSRTYNLLGQRVDASRKGLVIRNHKKVLVK